MTRHVGLTIEASTAPLTGQSDSDWDVKHSTTDYLFKLRARPSSVGRRPSSREPIVALSSCEAEIMALSEASKEACGCVGCELGVSMGQPTQLAEPPTTRPRAGLVIQSRLPQEGGGIEWRHIFVRECV